MELLDAAHVSPRAALWVRRGETEEWRLMLAMETARSRGPKAAYTEVLAVFRANEDELNPLEADDLAVVEPRHTLIRLHQAIFNVPGINRIRSEGIAVQGQLLPDSVIYRLEPAPAESA